MAYKTPGVYVEEVSELPHSVAEVETAIPAFIGYTEMARDRAKSLHNKPTRISSMAEFTRYFGGEHNLLDDIEDTSLTAHGVKVVLNDSNYLDVSAVTPSRRYYMHSAVRQFFDNGGGECYIVSAGDFTMDIAFSETTSQRVKHGLSVGLKQVRKCDDVTIILFPDAVGLSNDNDFYRLQKRALNQCAKLGDRVALLDLQENKHTELDDAVDAFRQHIGVNSLQYGIAYTPWLYTVYRKKIDLKLFQDTVYVGTQKTELNQLTTDVELNEMVSSTQRAVADNDTLIQVTAVLSGDYLSFKDQFAALSKALVMSSGADAGARLTEIIDFMQASVSKILTLTSALRSDALKVALDTLAKQHLVNAICELIAIEKNADVRAITGNQINEVNSRYLGIDESGWLAASDTPLISTVAMINGSTTDYGQFAVPPVSYSDNKDTALNVLYGKIAVSSAHIPQDMVVSLEQIFGWIEQFVKTLHEKTVSFVEERQTNLYTNHEIIRNIVEHIQKEYSKIPPSGAVAGRYALVDSTRGVWKAPANISIENIHGPVEYISSEQQASLNVDVNAGKSINAIRSFAGRGHLIWGARTLAGNDNEWRYVPVRRFFNMIEESIKKSIAWVVFEPNDASTWAALEAMINNYLMQKWRQGALAGTKPEDAFFVKVGLGETMIEQDIVDGRIIIEIGMAAVRPAEFILMRIQRKA